MKERKKKVGKGNGTEDGKGNKKIKRSINKKNRRYKRNVTQT